MMTLDPIKIRLFASLGLGFLAAAASWLYLDFRENEILEKGENVEILVASKYVPALTRLENEWFAYRKVPKAFAPRGYVKNTEEIQGQISLVPFNYKEPFLFNKLSDTGARLSDAVPERMRAFTLSVDKVTGLAGLARPGDLVDIYHLSVNSKKNGSKVLFQAVKILAVAGTQNLSSNENRFDTVTIALSPLNCSLAMSAAAQGTLQLALRPTGDKRILSHSQENEEPAPDKSISNAYTPNSKDSFIIRKR